MAIINSSSQAAISNGFLRLATEIVQNSQSPEEALRTAISRAYYSVYLTARDRLFGSDAIGLTRKKREALIKRLKRKHKPSGSHDRVLFALTDLSSTSTIHPLVLSQQIGELKAARIHADYNFTKEHLREIPYDTWSEYADKMVAFASQLLPVTRQLPSYPST